MQRLESDTWYRDTGIESETDDGSTDDPDAPAATINGDAALSGSTGLGASLYRGMQGAKKALASALLRFALRDCRLDAAHGADSDGEGTGPPYDFADDDLDVDDAAAAANGACCDDESGGSGVEDSSRHNTEGGASRGAKALSRFGTLKRIEQDDDWVQALEPGDDDLTPEELNSDASTSSSAAPSTSSAPSASAGGVRDAPAQPPAARSTGRSSRRTSSSGGSSSRTALPPGALNLWQLRGGPKTAWEPPIYGAQICKKEYTTVASDGWTLHIVHTIDRGVPPERRRKHPVLLCPGLASSGVGTFDLMPHVSFVDYLASHGWDVWCVCLRGNGASDKQSRIDISSWTIDDHLFQDVPAVLAFVLNKTGAKKVHWIGHSMGGMLGCGLLSQGDSSRYSDTLKTLVMYGSGCFGDGSWHSLLKRIVIPVTKLGFPADLACQGLSLLTDKPTALSVFETLFYWFPNVEHAVRKRLLQSCFNFIPTTLTGQFLDSHDGRDGLMNVRHTFKYADPDVLAETSVPVVSINGDWDLFCPAAGGKKTVDMFGGPKESLCFGTAQGHSSHYGHFDVIVGKNAKEEVWPRVLGFLERYDDYDEDESS